MHSYNLKKWQHEHVFLNDETASSNERRTFYVVLLTLAMMVVEISAGWYFNSMALLADGWHMASHAGALGLTVLAYRFARTHARDRSFTFGVGKVEVLGGYSNAIVLLLVALFMAYESVLRILHPLEIAFNQAILVAVVGLIVNLFSAWLLGGDHHHHHHDHDHASHDHAAHDHDHDHAHDHEDHNLKAAYLHVLADALTSVLAIAALLLGKHFGWNWTDALMGIFGAFVISKWAIGLLKSSGAILLDRISDEALKDKIKNLMEADADNRVADQHVWYIGGNKYAAIVSVVTHYPRSAEHYRSLLKSLPQLAHITIETNICEGKPCIELPELQDYLPQRCLGK